MALSFCSNMESLQYSELTSDHDQLLGLYDNFSFTDAFNVPPFLELDELFYSDINDYTNLLSCFSNYSTSNNDTIMSLSPEIFPLDDFDAHHYPKRQKSYHNHYYSDFAPNFLDGYLSNATLVPEFLPYIPASVPKFEVPAVHFATGRSDNQSSVKKLSEVRLSAQSIAARERRRKITEKTHELGKLVPGGNKMNTAEMLQAASKYVKFLQAQVKILELMGSIQEGKEPMHTQVLQLLLASTTIQEKLYSEEKCLVPREFVQVIVEDHEIQSQPLIIEEIDELLRTDG